MGVEQDEVHVERRDNIHIGGSDIEPLEFTKEIETKYDVASIKANGIPIWAVLRGLYIEMYTENHIFNTTYNQNRNKALRVQNRIPLRTKIGKLRNVLFGAYNLFRVFDILIFSDTLEIRTIAGYNANKIFHTLMRDVMNGRCLLIENPVYNKHPSKFSRLQKQVISLDLFQFIYYIRPTVKDIEIINEHILQEINTSYDLQVDYKKAIEKFFGYREVFRSFYKRHKPKIVFLSTGSSVVYNAVASISKEQNIIVAEIQHGTLSAHPYFHVYADIGKDIFPDYLFVWGNKAKESLSINNYFIDIDNVIPVGSMYIDYINNQSAISNEVRTKINKLREEYKYFIAISSQYTVAEQLIEFIKRCAEISPEVLYLYIPRDMNNDYRDVEFPKNVIVLKELDVYKTIKYSDFHATVYSSCAIEAPALGTRNILINIKNFSRIEYENVLTDQETTRFVETPEEFVRTVREWETKSKKYVKDRHKEFILTGHAEHLSKALCKILKEEAKNEKMC